MNDPRADDIDLIQEIVVAVMHPEPGAALGQADFLLLQRAADSGVMPPERFAAVLRGMCGEGSLAFVSRRRFRWAMDYLFGHGFRDEALPELAPDYRDFLDAAKRVLDISDEAFAAMLARAPRGATPDHVTGEAFAFCLYEMFTRQRMAIPNLPHREHVDRASMGYVNAAVSGLGLTYAEHMNVVVAYGGGCMRPRDLDVSGLQRVVARYVAAGWTAPEPPPRIGGRGGRATQAQINLICKLARDIFLPTLADLDEWLRIVAGIEGGLSGMMLGDATIVLDRMLPPVIALREIRDGEVEARATRQMGQAMGFLPAA